MWSPKVWHWGWGFKTTLSTRIWKKAQWRFWIASSQMIPQIFLWIWDLSKHFALWGLRNVSRQFIETSGPKINLIHFAVAVPIYKQFQWTISRLVQGRDRHVSCHQWPPNPPTIHNHICFSGGEPSKWNINILGTSTKVVPDSACYVLTGTPVVNQEQGHRVCDQFDNDEFIDFFQNAPIALHWQV